MLQLDPFPRGFRRRRIRQRRRRPSIPVERLPRAAGPHVDRDQTWFWRGTAAAPFRRWIQPSRGRCAGCCNFCETPRPAGGQPPLLMRRAIANGRPPACRPFLQSAGTAAYVAANPLGFARALPRSSEKTMTLFERLEPDLDAGIRDVVRVLIEAGVETFESCEGGHGHAFAAPTVRFHGYRDEGLRALAVAQQHGLRVATLRRYWEVIDGELTGPHWEMVLVSPQAAPSAAA